MDVTIIVDIYCVSYSWEGNLWLKGITDENNAMFTAKEITFIFLNNLVLEDVDTDYDFCFGI